MASLPQPGFLFSALMMIVLISILVTVHEFGHYLVGRFFGVKVLAFSVGMGPEIFHRVDKSGTRWRIGALPIGGYCKFLGDMDATSRPDNEAHQFPVELKAQAFPFKPLWQRFLIVFAGPAINILFAIILFWGLFLAKGVTPDNTVIGSIGPSAAAQNLRVGDRIVAINGREVKSFMKLAEIVMQNPQQKMEFTVERDGSVKNLAVVTGLRREKDRWGNIYKFGTLNIVPYIPAIAGHMLPNSSAAKAGMKPGDKILTANGKSVFGFADMRAVVRASPGQPVRIEVDRGGERQTLTVIPRAVSGIAADGEKGTVGEIGVQYVNEKVGPIAAIGAAAGECVRRVDQALAQLWRMISGRVSLDEMGGMLRIGEAAGVAAAMGWDTFVNLMALISITLAVMNLLPVPVLDGGHLALYAAEAVRGKPLNPHVLEMAFTAGFVLIVGLMLFLFWNDLRLFGVWRSLAGLWS